MAISGSSGSSRWAASSGAARRRVAVAIRALRRSSRARAAGCSTGPGAVPSAGARRRDVGHVEALLCRGERGALRAGGPGQRRRRRRMRRRRAMRARRSVRLGDSAARRRAREARRSGWVPATDRRRRRAPGERRGCCTLTRDRPRVDQRMAGSARVSSSIRRPLGGPAGVAVDAETVGGAPEQAVAAAARRRVRSRAASRAEALGALQKACSMRLARGRWSGSAPPRPRGASRASSSASGSPRPRRGSGPSPLSSRWMAASSSSRLLGQPLDHELLGSPLSTRRPLYSRLMYGPNCSANSLRATQR